MQFSTQGKFTPELHVEKQKTMIILCNYIILNNSASNIRRILYSNNSSSNHYFIGKKKLVPKIAMQIYIISPSSNFWSSIFFHNIISKIHLKFFQIFVLQFCTTVFSTTLPFSHFDEYIWLCVKFSFLPHPHVIQNQNSALEKNSNFSSIFVFTWHYQNYLKYLLPHLSF